MRLALRSTAICLAASLLPAALYAGPVGWKCSIPQPPKSGWITKEYLFNYDAEAGQAEVVDPMIFYYRKAFMPAEIKQDGGKTIDLTWTVRAESSARVLTDVRFDATLVKATRQLRMSSTTLGFDNVESVRGTCEAVEGPLVIRAR